MEPTRTDLLVGAINPEAIAATYQCGHCNSTTELRTTDGIVRVAIHHDDGCPILTGALSSAPDALRAIAASVPDTFRPAAYCDGCNGTAPTYQQITHNPWCTTS
ncbi:MULTISPECIES: hypothetical protein [Streptomyces]|uniref:Uncharacterized protein n=2 Tax=Streptomyces TaxID=1883 RepID=A0A2U9P1Z5_STRAS|nr:hypothetical protein [Streptomyces actuosus]AWT43195.1 hypothetical protein DMT42_13265 [Streptomyces actuosus]MBM4824652.1 hypothetical protein [Streptomyces actuosus]